MGDEKVYFFRINPVALQYPTAYLPHLAHREFENGLAFLVYVVHLFLNCFA